MAKKRTTAQRRAAAKLAWQRRRLAAAVKPSPSKGPWPVPQSLKQFAQLVQEAPTPEKVYVHPPKIGYAVKEGDDIFVCFGEDGSIRRERVSMELAKKVYLDLAKIVVV